MRSGALWWRGLVCAIALSLPVSSEETPRPNVQLSIVRQQDLKKDLSPGWVRSQLAEAPGAEVRLVVVEGAPPVPVRTERGTFDLLQFSAFVDAEFNNTRNAFRLLGAPATCVEEGDVWTAIWIRRVEKRDGSPVTVTVRIHDSGNDVTWSYADGVGEIKPVPKY